MTDNLEFLPLSELDDENVLGVMSAVLGRSVIVGVP